MGLVKLHSVGYELLPKHVKSLSDSLSIFDNPSDKCYQCYSRIISSSLTYCPTLLVEPGFAILIGERLLGSIENVDLITVESRKINQSDCSPRGSDFAR